MVRGSNNIDKSGSKKDYFDRIKTWLDQPGKKKTRRNKRALKAKLMAPRPVGLFRPQVMSCTIQYSNKPRLGRGFTLEELKAAGISAKEAPTIGIAVDLRRTNKSVESMQTNVVRLQGYMAKLVIFPKKSGKGKKGDTSNVSQVNIKDILPIKFNTVQDAPRKATKAEKESNVYLTLRTAHTDDKRWGARHAAKAKLAAKKK